MKEKRNCKIVQDLLPNYIEGLTKEETNKYIEDHLNECEECKKILENMKKEIELNKPKKNEKEVKYIKKFNKRFRLVTTILILIVLIFTIIIGRKIIILTDISRKIGESRDTSNYHMKLVRYSNGKMTNVEVYCKDNKILYTAVGYSSDGKVTKVIAYQSEDECFSIADFEGNKKLIKTSKIIIPHSVYTDDIKENIKFLFMKNVKKDNLKGRECYVISDGESKEYIDRETGCIIKVIDSKMDYMTNLEYEYGIVKDEDIKRPDTTGYAMQE